MDIKTIGYGHACHASDCSNIHPPITRAQGEALLKKDLVIFEKCVDSLTKIPLNSPLCVHLPLIWVVVLIRDPHLRRKLNAHDTKGASLEFRKWVYAGGKKLPGLVRRREAERRLFCMSGGC